ncbi:MAG: ATPase [Oscillospiraceae bacterium]|nr:ATPase [Oscillospiraceae bacterium]
MYFLLPLIAIILLFLPIIPIYKKVVSSKQMKNRLIFNISSFIGIFIIFTIVPVITIASAESTSTIVSDASGLGYIAAALVTGFSTIGAGIAVAAAAPAAIGALSEDPKSFGKALIFVALGEGVALYGLLISILILNKI